MCLQDFGKYPYMRRFIQDFIQALNCHNDGVNMVRNFVKRFLYHHYIHNYKTHPLDLMKSISLIESLIITLLGTNVF